MWEVVIVKIVTLRFANDELERETDTLRGNIAKWPILQAKVFKR